MSKEIKKAKPRDIFLELKRLGLDNEYAHTIGEWAKDLLKYKNKELLKEVEHLERERSLEFLVACDRVKEIQQLQSIEEQSARDLTDRNMFISEVIEFLGEDHELTKKAYEMITLIKPKKQ
jgi:hypothetical protein